LAIADQSTAYYQPVIQPGRTAFLAAVCVAAAVRLWLGPHVIDDAYITFRYSDRIAAGLGFTYNDGQHVLGTTSPLFALLLAVASRAHLPLSAVALAISILADSASILLGAAMLQRAGWQLSALVYALFVAGWPMFLRYSVSGLETSLYVALLLAALYLMERERPVALGVTLAALVLCRIDGGLMAFICALAICRRPTAYVTYAAAAVTIAPWVIFTLWYFHSPVPASVQAKAHMRSTIGGAAAIFGAFFMSGPYRVLSLLALPGAVAAARSSSAGLRMGLLWWGAYVVLFIVTGAFGPYPWYVVPLLPVYFMALALTIEIAIRRAVSSSLQPIASLAAVAIIVVGIGVRLPVLQRTLDDWGTREAAYREVAERVVDPHDCVLAATEIGALGYFYRGPILDLMGLVSPQSVGRPISQSIAAATPCWIVSYSDLLGMTTIPAGYRLRYSRVFNPSRSLLVFERR
jgi:hypothetical protein